MNTTLEYNRELYKDLIRYGTILTDIIFDVPNVRIQTIRDTDNNIWFVRIQNGSVYDCLKLTYYNGIKRVFYKEEEGR